MAEAREVEQGRNPFLTSFAFPAPAAAAASAKRSASANQGAGSLFRIEHSRGPPPSLSLQLFCHLFPAGLQACDRSLGAHRSRTPRGEKERRAQRAVWALHFPPGGGLSGSGLQMQGFHFGTSASCWAPATLKPITQGACLFAAAKSN